MLLHLDTLLLCHFLAFAQANFDPNTIDPSTKTQWCDSQRRTCELLCGGSSETLNNKCDSDSLKYTCLCNDEREPDVWGYEGTIPTLECEHDSSGCAAPKDASAGQSICQCGTLDPNSAKAIVTSTGSGGKGTGGSGGLVLPTNSIATTPTLSGLTTLTTTLSRGESTTIVATLRILAGSTTGTLSGLASATSGSTSKVRSAARATAESSSSIAAASAVGASANPQLSPSPLSSNAQSSGLSLSTKIGIGLGVPLGVLILAITAFIIFYFQTKRKLKANKAELDQLDSHPEVLNGTSKENDGEQGTHTAQPTGEMDAGPRLRGQGMMGCHGPGEMGTDSGTGERLVPWNRHEMLTLRADFGRSAAA
ncbi:hypothetical protein G7Y79_00056g090300 [Physcia stellaris]|nr:hypothetical protein G7Y79_00056g090300 [Physcia stellaris]